MNFKRINSSECQQLMSSQAVTVLDIRDPQSYQTGHIDGSLHIEQIDMETFLEEQPKSQSLVVCCYHGNSSQSAAAYFAEKGFTDVYSLDGGYEGWPKS